MTMFKEVHERAVLGVSHALAEIGAHEEALEVLERTPEDERGSEFWIEKGSYLSLLDQDQEALQCFEQASRGPLTLEQTVSLTSERALSLKRLGRFKEAEKLYLDLLPRVSGEDHTRVAVNLASVYLESDQAPLAADLLSRYIVDNPDHPLVLAQLGDALDRTGNPDQAIKYYQRAIALDASMANIQVRLARLLLTHRLDAAGASTALYVAYQQGYNSEEWMTLTLAAEGICGNAADLKNLLREMRRELPPEQVAQIEQASMRIMRNVLARIAGQPTKDDPVDTPPPARPQAEAVAALKPDEHPTNATAHPGAPAPPPTDPKTAPFMNYRMYMPEGRYSVDWYADIDADSYPEEFERAWNTLRRDPRLIANEPRTTPFYFTRCPDCLAIILTSRDLGKNLNCRRCDQKTPPRYLTQPEPKRSSPPSQPDSAKSRSSPAPAMTSTCSFSQPKPMQKQSTAYARFASTKASHPPTCNQAPFASSSNGSPTIAPPASTPPGNYCS